jgi:hypothetical protein
MGLNKYGMRLIPVLLIAILGLASLAWGIWTLAAPARQVGQYPRYGHAADFSWIAGEMLYHVPVDAKLPEMGCSIFRYEEQGTQVKLEGPGWRAISDLRETRPQPGTFLVLFGHPARAGEQFICAKDVPGYFVERVQVNPAP